MALTIAAFIFILGLLVLVHELGHFLLAKKIGVQAEEFAFGFGPALWKKRKKAVLWRINLVPLGGYVKLLGEEGLENDLKKENSFASQKRSSKAIIVVAGVLMNFILAWVIFTIGFSFGMPSIQKNQLFNQAKVQKEIMIGGIMPGSPAEKAGLKLGDAILELGEDGNFKKINSVEEVRDFTSARRGREIAVKLKSGVKKIQLSKDEKAPLGIGMVDYITVKIPIWLSPVQALTETGWGIWLTLKGIYVFFQNLLIRGEVMEGASGPVGIFVYTQAAVQIGLPAFLQFIAILSINLGLINILPFPALDGGRLVFIGLESIFHRRTRLHEIENIIHLIGFVLLILLVLAITYRDVLRLGG